MAATTKTTLLTTRRFEVVEHTVERGGKTIRTPIVVHPGAVVVLPLVDDDHVCLIRCYRLTAERELVELPAGTREPDEPPIETARRELAEETGYIAGNLASLATFYTSPGVLSEKMHAFVAKDLKPGIPAREENEQIENLVVTWNQALEMADRGEIEDGKTLVTLFAYDRQRNRTK